MADVSNRTIVALFLVALLITVGGTIISINKLVDFEYSFADLIVGAVTENTTTGTAELTITTITQITNQIAVINFSSGYVNQTCSNCTMDTDIGQQNTSEVSDADGDCCVGWENITQGFLVENTGNENVTVNFSCAGECNASEFIGGTNPRYMIKTSPNSIAQQGNESSDLDTVPSCDGQLNSTYKELVVQEDGGGWFFCGPNGTSQFNNYTFSPAGDRDAFVLDINVSIPSDGIAGVTNTSVFTFTAESIG